MNITDVETYTIYEVEFYQPQWLRCFRGPSRTFESAALVFFRVKFDNRLYYRRPDTGTGYPLYDGMIKNIKSIERLCGE